MGTRMNKSDLVKIMAAKGGISTRNAETFVNLIFDALSSALMKEERIEIRGFGSFTIRHYDAYEGRNPRSGTPTSIPAKRLPHFKAGRDITDRINNR